MMLLRAVTGIFEVYAALRRLYGTVQVVARPLRQDLVDCLQLHQLKSWFSELVVCFAD